MNECMSMTERDVGGFWKGSGRAGRGAWAGCVCVCVSWLVAESSGVAGLGNASAGLRRDGWTRVHIFYQHYTVYTNRFNVRKYVCVQRTAPFSSASFYKLQILLLTDDAHIPKLPFLGDTV